MADPRQPEPFEEDPDDDQNTGDAADSGSSAEGRPAEENPLAAMLNQLGLNLGDASDLGGVMEQLQTAFNSMTTQFGGMFNASAADSESGVNWTLAKDTARKTVASLGADPSPNSADSEQIADAVAIAEVWLDDATDFPRVGSPAKVWSRAQWVEETMPIWRRLVEPVATHIADAMANTVRLGEDDSAAAAQAGLAGMEQMLRPMLRSSGASMFGLQLGQGLGRLATEVVGATDIGLPLHDHVALIPTNIRAFGVGLDQTHTDVTLYLALRECARQRLFGGVGWLRNQVLTLVESYARGISIDTSALEEALGDVDPNNLEKLSSTLEGGLFVPQKTPEQQAVLAQLETMLALVEGWVDEVVAQATARWMPAAGALAETVRRNRATGGPAEATFATLVGLELRPRRMRDAANLWAALRNAHGPSGRDAKWKHPDIAPTAADLDDPIGYVTGDRNALPTASSDPAPETDVAIDTDTFDAELAKLLEAEAKMDQLDDADPPASRDETQENDTDDTDPPTGRG